MLNRSALFVVLLGPALASGCQSPRPYWPFNRAAEAEFAGFGERRQAEWDKLNRLKGEIRWEYDDPVEFTFPGHGELLVRDWYLEGGPGWEYVRARFTYRNTTSRPVDRVKVILTVLDAEGRTVSASKVKLTHPWGLPVAPGMMFSDEIRVPTLGAHNLPEGWHWQFALQAVPYEPIPEIATYRSAG